MKSKNLLIITPEYPDNEGKVIGNTFVKSQVDLLSRYFKKIYVISIRPYVPEILSRFGIVKYNIPRLENYTYEPHKRHEIEVYYKRFFHLPTKLFRRMEGDRKFKITEKIIKKENIRFDLIHCHFSGSGYVGARLKEKYGKPSVITIHEDRNWFLEEYKSKEVNLLYAWKNSDLLIRVNTRDVALLKKYNPNTIRIPNGYDKKKFYPLDKKLCRKKLDLPLDKKLLFTLSFLNEQKGHKYAIQAINKVVKEKKDILYLIGGSGNLKSKLQKQINNLNLQNNVKLLGFVPNELLNYYLNACDLFVLPSLSEGNPTVMFECLGCGKPFIGTKVGGEPEVITSKEYGYLVEPGNSEELKNAILFSLKQKWNTRKILDYSIRFEWGNITKRILNCYKGLFKTKL